MFLKLFSLHFISWQSHPPYYIKTYEKQCNKNTSPPVMLTIMWTKLLHCSRGAQTPYSQVLYTGA